MVYMVLREGDVREFLKTLEGIPFLLPVVVDEAHCIYEWLLTHYIASSTPFATILAMQLHILPPCEPFL